MSLTLLAWAKAWVWPSAWWWGLSFVASSTYKYCSKKKIIKNPTLPLNSTLCLWETAVNSQYKHNHQFPGILHCLEKAWKAFTVLYQYIKKDSLIDFHISTVFSPGSVFFVLSWLLSSQVYQGWTCILSSAHCLQLCKPAGKRQIQELFLLQLFRNCTITFFAFITPHLFQ